MDRREFLRRATKTGLSAGVTAGIAASPLGRMTKMAEAAAKPKGKGIRKAVILNMVQGGASTTEKFKIARDCGWDGLEISPVTTPEQIEDINKAVQASGIPVHSIIFGGWKAPLSTADEKLAEQGIADLKAGLKGAKAVGADGLLLVPAVVNKETRYVDAYKRSQKRIKSVLPLAKDLGVKINIEEVWNKFLLSPLEFARYVDEFKSPWVRAYFDVANVIDFGWPEDWIRTLDDRIEKVHIKDFKRQDRSWPALGEGDADFPTVMKALRDIGFQGWFTCELPGGDEAYLKEVARRVDRIIAGENPAA